MINYQHTQRPTMPTPTRSVTLTQGDTYSLTTGRVTRTPSIATLRHTDKLIMNDMITLHALMIRDESILMCCAHCGRGTDDLVSHWEINHES